MKKKSKQPGISFALYHRLKFSYVLAVCVVFIGLFAVISLQAGNIEKKPMTLQDMMKFRALNNPLISDKGDWVIYTSQPGRGNGELIAHSITDKKNVSIPRGDKGIISSDSKWVAAAIQPDAIDAEKPEMKDKLKPGMALLETATGKITSFEKVKGFAFSDNGNWLAYWLFPEEKKEEKPGDEMKPEAKQEVKEVKPEPKQVEIKPEEKKPEEKKPEEKKKETPKDDEEKIEASILILRELSTGKEIKIENVTNFILDPASKYASYTIMQKEGDQNRLCVRNLEKNTDIEKIIHVSPNARYNNLTWSKKLSRLAFIFYSKIEKKAEPLPASTEVKPTEPAKPAESAKSIETSGDYTSELLIWDGAKDKLTNAVSPKRIPSGWVLPQENQLTWATDENRLFFGLKPKDEYEFTHPKKEKPNTTTPDLFDIDGILTKRGVDVWHWQDDYLNPTQKLRWERFKRETYMSVYHIAEDRFVQLGGKDIPTVQAPENPSVTLGISDCPYRVESTWAGPIYDLYTVDLKTGAKQKIVTRQSNSFTLSTKGRYILYFSQKHWHLFDIRLNSHFNLTENIPVPFYNEDNDTPAEPGEYYFAGWSENDESILVYDKFDIWEFSTSTHKANCLTNGEGRKNKIKFRIRQLDPEQKFFKKGETLLLTGYSEEEKYTGIYSAVIGQKGVKKLLSVPGKNFALLKKAKNVDKILFTRESFEEFPDLQVSDSQFNSTSRISNVNPEMENYLWGKAELMDWQSLDGLTLQGVVIKPENYDKNKRYPVLVYFYETMSERLCEFNEVVINHRPCFPYYTGNGYVIFLPDIKFEVGRPGFSSLKCLVPGVQKLISSGIADPKAIALHGHSWSGYLTAYIITQTDLFKAAIAGAAVSDMVSAYNGIRWESGIARQSQYEKTQSRIGPPLSVSPQLYIENSPVFYADRVNTPVLLEFGDKDGAVPWYQGIEYYLALRRLNKNVIMLQYNDEGHHLQKFTNKLDYTIKMKEYLDYYLKGAPAPDWITKGLQYQKK